MSQIQVKQIITSLCNILESFNFSKITPEDFRQAKFNKPEIVKKFWKLLYELIIFLEKNSGKKGLIILNSSTLTDADFNNEKPELMIKYIKYKMVEYGYECEDLYKLEETFESEKASRDLLIAISWFISSYEIVDLFANNSQCLIDEEYFKETALKNTSIDDLIGEVDKMRQQFKSMQSKETFNQVNYIKWLDGLFKMRINAYNSCLKEKIKLTHKAHELTKSLNSGHFSCLELYLLKNPKYMDKYEKIIEKNNELKTSLLYWIQNEDLYWKWMESVVDEKLAEKANTNQYLIENDSPMKSKEFETKLIKAMKETIKEASENESKFGANLTGLKAFATKMENAWSFKDDDLNDFTKINVNQLKLYEMSVNDKFEAIVRNDTLKAASHKQKLDYLNLELFEPRLSLVSTGAKSTKSAAENNPEKASIKDHINRLKLECNYLDAIYEERKLAAIEKCEHISNQLNNCNVIFNK